MTSLNSSLHLTLTERQIIEKGIINGTKKSYIACIVGKDKSTICKEIKLHRYLATKCPLSLGCTSYKKCTHGRNCKSSCIDYVHF